MTNEWDGYCAICATQDRGGEVRFEGSREGGALAPRIVQVCAPCYNFIALALRTAVLREGELDAWPHLPERQPGASHGCALCGGDPGPAELFVNSQPAGAALTLERPSSYRACPACLEWVAEVIDEESLARLGERRHRPEPGRDETYERRAALGVGVAFNDEAVLADALRGMGHTYCTSSAREAPFAAGDPHTLLFIGAGPGVSAASVLGALARSDRSRAIVVAQPGYIGDATEALRLGATDLLASPLSRRQVTGALERLQDRQAVTSRDPVTGLPVYQPAARFGLPCHVLAIKPLFGTRSVDIFLILRRFLRGYDRIGMQSDGTIPVHLFCEDGDLPGVMRRLGLLLGGLCDVSLRETIAPTGPVPIDRLRERLRMREQLGA